MQNDKITQLSVSTEVLEKMAEIAAVEVSGVSSLSKKAIDLKGAVKTKNPFKGVKVENVNGAIEITVYLTVKQGVNVCGVSEDVQNNVKDKIQTMTGTAVTRVNVVVADIELPHPDDGEESKEPGAEDSPETEES